MFNVIVLHKLQKTSIPLIQKMHTSRPCNKIQQKNMLIERLIQLAYFMIICLINALCRSLELLDSREYDIP